MNRSFKLASFSVILFSACSHYEANKPLAAPTNKVGQPVYQDKPFVQEYSVKYYFTQDGKKSINPYQVSSDRNHNIQITTSAGLFAPYNGQFLMPGQLLPVRTYRYMQNRQIAGLISYQRQFVYADERAIFSNAWAGSLYTPHGMHKPACFAGGQDFDFLVADDSCVAYFDKTGKRIWASRLRGVLSLKFNAARNGFLIVTRDSLCEFRPKDQKFGSLFKGHDITCATPAKGGLKIVLGSSKGYRWLTKEGEPDGKLINTVPCPEITAVEEINDQIWFGSSRGAYKLNSENKYDYYASERWLTDNNVVAITPGPEESILVLTKTGLSQICFRKMTLQEKAMAFEEQTRKYHIRYGFSSTGNGMTNGNVSQVTVEDSDNDGLWTGMYLGGQLFRYAATKDPEAWENCKEALLGFERLYSITGIPGLPARAYEVQGYETSGYSNAFSEQTKDLFVKSGYDVKSSPWRRGTDSGWVWKSTTSSDEIVGHYFALCLFADLAEDVQWKNRAKKLVSELSEYLYKNNLYLIDWNGKPTTWGKWNPEYVNGFPPQVGDRKLTSSNVTGFLQAAYHITKDEKYKQKVLELFQKNGYLENLMRPMKEIGKIEGTKAGKVESWSQMLSDGWNYSDDEMYFLGYWCLYPYALTDELKANYQTAIRDHWEIVRPEKDPVWNFTYAMTGAREFDLDESIWWLKNYPLDLTSWKIENSNRQDIDKIPENFMGRHTREAISPSEGVVKKHNGSRFQLDEDGNGRSVETPGDVWLLPYWMGRYLGIISAPSESK